MNTVPQGSVLVLLVFLLLLLVLLVFDVFRRGGVPLAVLPLLFSTRTVLLLLGVIPLFGLLIVLDQRYRRVLNLLYVVLHSKTLLYIIIMLPMYSL